MSESLIDRLAVAIHLGTSMGARGNHPSNIYNLAQEALEALRAASLSPEPMAQEGGEWVRDTAMNVMLATEVEEACRILTNALARPASPAPAQQEGVEVVGYVSTTTMAYLKAGIASVACSIYALPVSIHNIPLYAHPVAPSEEVTDEMVDTAMNVFTDSFMEVLATGALHDAAVNKSWRAALTAALQTRSKQT